MPNVTAARNPFTTDYLNYVGSVQKQQGLTMGETQSVYYEEHEPVPYITSEMPQEVKRNKNRAAYDYQSMVPSLPFYPGEEIPDIGESETVIIDDTSNEIIVNNFSGAKTILATLAFLMIVYYFMKRS